ncbi:hypothetical protein Bcep18194_C7273 [Burkholderia lata]|uniref:Uncharacterized protein n=1 Tax=Burkholderia lata (strain ATCC 17760 / DSM 23089 / LMG 22485 / NCIMB 9086 / R18194 / 383) TaxID=482957 RepID=Q39MJ9_BURL3|nr:hypothetical protein Bcep18194_C7273 [Burkholderia lata]
MNRSRRLLVTRDRPSSSGIFYVLAHYREAKFFDQVPDFETTFDQIRIALCEIGTACLRGAEWARHMSSSVHSHFVTRGILRNSSSGKSWGDDLDKPAVPTRKRIVRRGGGDDDAKRSDAAGRPERMSRPRRE